jgi:hypothetical protein
MSLTVLSGVGTGRDSTEEKENEMSNTERVEITPAMLEAGANAVWEETGTESDSWSQTWVEQIAREVYRAMATARSTAEPPPRRGPAKSAPLRL